MASDDEAVGIDAVNAWLDHEKSQVVIALRVRGEEKYRTFRMTHADGDQLQGMLYLLVGRGWGL